MKPFLTLLFCTLLLSCTAAAKPDFTLTDQPISAPLAGFGACMNPYLYAYPNMPQEISEQQVKDAEAKIIALHPQFVRVFFLNSWMEKDTDPSIAKNHPGMRQSLIRTLRLMQNAGATVLLQLWYDPERYSDPEGVARRLAQHIAELRNSEHLTCIRYATIQNEPNDDDKDITMETYAKVYRAFDHQLRQQHLRDDIKIVGGDLLKENQKPWFEMMSRDLWDVLDGYSIHNYWDYWDIERMLRHIAQVKEIIDTLPEHSRKPVYMDEFGAQGFRASPSIEPGNSADGKPLASVPVYSFEIAIAMLDGLNHGIIATAQWDMLEIWYDRKMGYGLLGPVEQGFPKKPGYSLLQMFTQNTSPGWRTMKVEGQIEDLWITALTGDPQTDTDHLQKHLQKETTVFLLSRLHGQKQVTLTGLPQSTTLHAHIWNANGQGQLEALPNLTTDPTGTLTVSIPHEAVEVLTTK